MAEFLAHTNYKTLISNDALGKTERKEYLRSPQRIPAWLKSVSSVVDAQHVRIEPYLKELLGRCVSMEWGDGTYI
jgi:hypothetical protein